MDYSTIILTEKDGIARLTLNRPDSLHALNMEILTELKYALGLVKEDKNLLGLIITGQGERSFCAGADLANLNRMEPKDYLEFIDVSYEVWDSIWNMPFLTVAAINGLALGGGCELAMACDLRIAVKEAVLGLPELDHGLLPGFGGLVLMSRILGRAKTLELALTGKTFRAEEALAMGMITQINSREELFAEAEKYVIEIAKKGPQIVKWTKQIINEYQTADLRKGFLHEALGGLAAFVTDDCRRGLERFTARKKKD
jgi:enoyl-CoA hydratase